MLQNISIRWRLQGTTAFLFLLLMIVGLLGQYGMRSVVGSLNEVYTNELPSAMKIAESETNMLQVRTVRSRRVDGA